MHNSFTLNVMFGTDKGISMLKFCEHVIKSLMGSIDGPQSDVHNPCDFHYLMPLPPTEKKDKLTKPCVVCSRQKKRKETRYFCEQCKINTAICVGKCFKDYHYK